MGRQELFCNYLFSYLPGDTAINVGKTMATPPPLTYTVAWRNGKILDYDTFGDKALAEKCVIAHRDTILYIRECHNLDILEILGRSGYKKE